MKKILLSIRPEWVEKILCGDKTLELRKSKPSIDTPFKCYIYCTKGGSILRVAHYCVAQGIRCWKRVFYFCDRGRDNERNLNGKVVGEFMCDTIYQLKQGETGLFFVNDSNDVLNSVVAMWISCLKKHQICDYVNHSDGYMWHIKDLVIYDKPKTLAELGVSKAPQSWCYCEELV